MNLYFLILAGIAALLILIILLLKYRPRPKAINPPADETRREAALKKIRVAQDLALLDLYTLTAQEMILEALSNTLSCDEE